MSQETAAVIELLQSGDRMVQIVFCFGARTQEALLIRYGQQREIQGDSWFCGLSSL